MWLFSPVYVFLKQKKIRFFHFDYNMGCFHFDDYIAGLPFAMALYLFIA